mgnify:CR=1 FL=1
MPQTVLFPGGMLPLHVFEPRYREMILGDELTPVGDLSSAFLTAKSDLHLQFAYYESSLVVQFLIEKFGVEKLRKILADLATGKEVNKAIAEHTAPLEKLEKDFAAYAKDLAGKLAPVAVHARQRPRHQPDVV